MCEEVQFHFYYLNCLETIVFQMDKINSAIQFVTELQDNHITAPERQETT